MCVVVFCQLPRARPKLVVMRSVKRNQHILRLRCLSDDGTCSECGSDDDGGSDETHGGMNAIWLEKLPVSHKIWRSSDANAHCFLRLQLISPTGLTYGANSD